MNNKLLLIQDNIFIYKTDIADIQWVYDLERQEVNSQYVFLWSKDEHLNSLYSPNILHLIVKDSNNNRLGYVIIDDLANEHHSINLRRIVIDNKNNKLGYMVIKMIIPYIFNNYFCHRLWLDVFTDNLRAIHLYTKLGFKQEGILRESYIKNGQYKSQIIMSMLKSEYGKYYVA